MAFADVRAVTIQNRRSGRAGGFFIGSAAGLGLSRLFASSTIDEHTDMAGLAYAVVGGIGWLAGGILGLFIGKQGDMERYIFKFYAKQKMKHAGKGDGYMIVPLE